MIKSVITAAEPTFNASEGTAAVARFNISPGLSAPAQVSVRIEGWGATPGTDFGALKYSLDGTNFQSVTNGVITIPAGATKLYLSTAIAADNLSHEPGEQIAFVLAQTNESAAVLDGSYYVASVATVVDTTPTPPKITGTNATIQEGQFAVGAFNLDTPLAFSTSVSARVEGYGITLGQDTSGGMQVRFNGSGSWENVSGSQIQLPVGTRSFELRVATVSDQLSESAETMNFVVAQTDQLLRDSYYVSSLITVNDVAAPASGGTTTGSTTTGGTTTGGTTTGGTTTGGTTTGGMTTGGMTTGGTTTGGTTTGGTTTGGTTTGGTTTGGTTTGGTTTGGTTAGGTTAGGTANDPFFVTESSTGVISFGGTATGEIEVFINGSHQAAFVRGGHVAATVVSNIDTKVIDGGHALAHFNVMGSDSDDVVKFLVRESTDPNVPGLISLRGTLGAGSDKIVLVVPDSPGAAVVEPAVLSTVVMEGGNDVLDVQILGADDTVNFHPGSVVADAEQITSNVPARFDAADALRPGTPAAAGSTFTVTELNSVVSFGGTATGEITVTMDSFGNASFSRGGVSSGTVVSNIGAKMLSTVGTEAFFNVLGTDQSETLKFRMTSETAQLVLRGDMGGGADTVVLSFPNVPSPQDRRKIVVDSTIQLYNADDTVVILQDDANDRIIIDDGSVLADFETYTVGTADLAGVVFIGVAPPAPPGGVPAA